MRLRPLYFFSLLYLIFWASSCQSTSDAIVLALSRAEDCMETHPDSALTILKNIPAPDKLHGKAQADYCLLMTQAMDKNYIKLESDSLIRFAVGYYGAYAGDIVSKGKAFYYYGKVMQTNGRHKDAISYFLKAKESLDDSKEYKMLGLISENIGYVNWEQNMFDEAFRNQKEAYHYYILANDTLSMSYALRNLGRVCYVQKNQELSLKYYTEALDLAHAYKLRTESYILQELGVFYRGVGDYNKAEYYFLLSHQLEKSQELKNKLNLSLGYLYLKMNKIEKAEEYLKMSLESPYIQTKIDAYTCLYRLEKGRRNYHAAVLFKENADSLSAKVESVETRKLIADLQSQYQNEKLQKEKFQLKVKEKNFILAIFVLTSIIVFMSLLYYLKNKRNKKYIREIENSILKNTKEITEYKQEIAKYQELQKEATEDNSKLGELKGKVMILNSQNKELTERLNSLGRNMLLPSDDLVDQYIPAFCLLSSLKCGSRKEKLSAHDREILFGLFDFMYSNFVTRLKEQYPELTKRDLEICCLLRGGFMHDELSRIFITTPDSVTKAKGRLKKRLSLEAQDDLNIFLLHY